MRIKLLKREHPTAKIQMPVRKTEGAAAWDIYMPYGGSVGFPTTGEYPEPPEFHPLGFSLEIPKGRAVLLLPRSGVGIEHGLYLRNTTGLIDSDYRGELKAAFGCHDGYFNWVAGDRLLQMILIPVETPELIEVDELSETERGDGGFGHTGRS